MEDIILGTIEDVKWEVFDFENDFEPVPRSRSNTWPVPQPENYFVSNFLTDTSPKLGSTENIKSDHSAQEETPRKFAEGSSRKKKSSRHNPWGDVSYAELITQAINSAENRRLTLSQIYDWMVQNVPFFRDKSESKSSAGWKNSVRHNLSLHNRFIRIPNESQGKSSWWAINPDVKSEKTTRRRSASMEAGKLEKKRALAKKQADSLRKKLFKKKGLTDSNDCINTDLQSSITNKHLQACFRPRAASCASSLGRLSTIPQIPEEPNWTTIEGQEPVIQPPMQPIKQEYQHNLNNQEYQPSNDQVFFASQNLPEVTNICLLHPVGGCNCNSSMQINSEIASTDSQGNFVIVNDSNILDVFSNICNNSVEIPQPTLLPHKVENAVNYNDCALFDQVNQATEVRALPRNNSMLDDINEIIKKDQIIEIEKVKDSISTTLFISNHNNNLLNFQ